MTGVECVMTDLKTRQLILASSSPRRVSLLKEAGLNPIVSPSSVDESVPIGLDFKETVMFLALKKALSKEAELLSKSIPNSVIVGADTVVSYDNKILGKPTNFDEAFETLVMLKNTFHEVATGVAVLEPGTYNRQIFVSTTKVTFDNYTDQNIIDYINSGEVWDKAGSYAIQGPWGKHVVKYDGDYNNIVGLPVKELLINLRNKFSISPLSVTN